MVYRKLEKDFPELGIAIDSKGHKWKLYEDRLESEKGVILPRFQTYNAFWFGWQAAFPNTVLVR